MRLPLMRKRAAGAVIAALSCAAPLVTGCSTVLVDGPPPREARRPGFTCTASPVWPVADISLAIAGLGAATYGMTKESTAAVGLGLGAVAAFGISAAMGAHRANACNRALGHPYVPHAPTAQPDMMPETPFGTAGTARSRAKQAPDPEDLEEQSAAAPPPRSAGPALAAPPDLGQ